MKLFSPAQMSWKEPLLFVLRLRTGRAWARRAAGALLTALAAFLVIRLAGGQLSVLQAAAAGLAGGVTLMALLDLGNVRRVVDIDRESVVCSRGLGAVWSESFPLDEIQLVRLLRPGEWRQSCGAMILQSGSDLFLVGVPRKVSLETIANVLHRLEVNVELDNWSPRPTDAQVRVVDELALADTAPTGPVLIDEVGRDEPLLGSLAVSAAQWAVAGGPLLVSVVAAIGAELYVVVFWSSLAPAQRAAVAGGAAAAVAASLVYLLLAGQFLAARLSVAAARRRLARRPAAVMDADARRLVPVEVFDRQAWTSANSRSVDFGFLQVDEVQRVLRLEGNRQRWQIPVSALASCRIEEAHGGGAGGEVRYYVVLSLQRSNALWEAGLAARRTRLGRDSNEQRYLRAQTLLDRIAAAVGAAPR